MSTPEIEKKVLDIITPTPEEKKHLKTVIQDLKKEVQREITKRKTPITTKLVGSIAKDTYLKNAVDIDLFLLFSPTISRDTLGKTGLSIGKAILTDTEESYAEHPYVRGYYKNYKTEIVPCYKVESASQKLSAVDRTPLHTHYVKDHLSGSQKKEIRLLKQFLRGIGCYGAEAEIEGFSGYLCEILIIKFESFHKLIEDAPHWRSGKKLYLHDGEYPSFETPLTFIDPVDPERNVASALSQEKFDLFVTACKDYLRYPRITFFFPNAVKPWPIKRIRTELEKQRGYFVGIQITKPGIIEENLYPQIRKAVRSIKERCERYDFDIIDARFQVDSENKNVYVILKTKQKQLPEVQLHRGPPTSLEENAHEFIQKWQEHPRKVKKPYEKKGRLYVELKREYRDIHRILNAHVKKLSLGKHLTKMVKKGYTVLDQKDLLISELSIFWTTYLDKKKPWER